MTGSRRISTTHAAELLHQIEQPGEEPMPRYFDRLSEAAALVRLLYPGLTFRGVTSRMRPFAKGVGVLTEALELPGLGRAWVGAGSWVWEPL